VEALAQASGVLMMKSLGYYEPEKVSFYLAGIDSTRFKRKVVPGDQLRLEVKVERARAQSLWKFKGIASVNGEVACETSFMNVRGEE